MADLPIGSDDGASQVEIIQTSTNNKLAIDSSGRVTVLQGTSPWSDNLTQVGGSAIALGQTTMSASIPVVIASDQTHYPIKLQDGAGTNLTSTLTGAKQALDINEVASATQSAAAAGQLYTTTFQVNLPTNGTESPTVFIKNPSGSGKTLVLKIVVAMPTAAVNGAALIRMYGNPTTSANGTAETISSTSVGGGAGATVMTAFSGPTVSANGTILFGSAVSSGNVSSNGVMPVNFDGAIRISANNTLLITGQPTTNNLNCTFTLIWQEV